MLKSSNLRHLSRLLTSALLACCLLLLAIGSVQRIKINGDGGEYLLMTHALAHHGSPQILPEDIDALRRAPFDMNFPGATYAAMQAHFKTAQTRPAYGFAAVEPGHYYSIHFWLYSLLAVPFYALTSLLGQNPLWAFGLLNASCLFAVMLNLRRIMPMQFWPAAALFLMGGASFYLDWTGPEVLSACCALVACIAMLRGELGSATLLAGLGASQNPSMLFLMPCAVAWRLILARWPALAWDEAGPTKVSKRDILSGLCGIVLALLPYCFFYALFGVPSLTGKYFTSPSLITANRLISLVADFDQGMLFGLPGLFAAPVLACLLLARGRRLAWLAAALAMLAALLVMAVPTLAAQNWNSGCVVVSRYGYWLAMPLAAAALSAMARLSLRRAGAVAALGAACQGAVIAQYGWLGQDSNALEHSRIAAWVLEHHPTLYHPDPEIFYERTTHGEAPLPLDLTLVYDYNGRQLKLMRNAAVVEPTPDFCPPGLRLEGINRTKVDRDWEYEDAPFTCKPPEAATGRTAWSFKRGHGDSQALLVAGWSKMEPFCTWSDGPRSELNLPLPANGKPLRIRTHGYYYLDQEKSELEADGKHLDAMDLHDGTFDLPASFNNKPYLKLVLQHPQASSPAARGDSPDVRQLGFCMEMISVESPE